MALYLTFILVGALLFAFVYFYSIRAQRAKRAKTDRGLNDLIDGVAVNELSRGSAKIPGPKTKSEPSVDVEVPVAVDTVQDVAGAAGATAQAMPSVESNTSTQSVAAAAVDKAVASSVDSLEPNGDYDAESTDHAPVEQRTAPALPDSNAPLEPLLKKGSTALVAESSLQSDPVLTKQSMLQEDSSVAAANIDAVAQTPASVENAAKKVVPTAADIAAAGAQQDFSSDAVEQSTAHEQPVVTNDVSWDQRECELVAKILGENAIARDDLLTIYRKYDFMLVRKLHIFGFNTLTQMWSDVEREDVSAVFTDLGVSVQLADKSGALTRKELNAVSQLVLELSDTYDRQFSFSMDLDEAIETGRELDELGRRHSAMVVLNIVPKRKEGFRSSDIDSCARDLNMSQSDAGVFTRYRRENARSAAQYHVAVADETGQFRAVKKQNPFRIHDIVVYLNVPAVENPSDAFVKMVDEARKLATWLDGKLVDKHRRNMTTKAIRVLTDQVGEIERHMLQDGVAPGGPLSQKLF